MGIVITVFIAVVCIAILIKLYMEVDADKDDGQYYAAPESKPRITDETLDYLAYQYEKRNVRMLYDVNFDVFVELWQNNYNVFETN